MESLRFRLVRSGARAFPTARAGVVAELADAPGADKGDVDAVRTRLDRARVNLDATSTIKRLLTSAENEVGRAKVSLETMRGEHPAVAV